MISNSQLTCAENVNYCLDTIVAPTGAMPANEVNRSINATNTFKCSPGFHPKLGIFPHTRCVAFSQERGKWENISGECEGVILIYFVSMKIIYIIVV